MTDPGGIRALLDGLIDAAVVVDQDRRVLAWNAAFAQVAGVRPRQLVGLVEQRQVQCCGLYRLEVCASECLVGRCLRQAQAVRLDEIRGQRRLPGDDARWQDGEAQLLIVSAVPLPAAGTVLLVYRDVTGEARIQERYKMLLERERDRAQILEQEVQRRTEDLERSLGELRTTRAQLVQSEKLSSLGQLVAGIAHELNNPINFITGNAAFLQQHVAAFKELIAAYEALGLSEADRAAITALRQRLDYDYVVLDVDKLVRSIAHGAERAASIVQNLRTFVHKGSDHMAPVDVADCMERTLSLLGHELRGRIRLERRYEPHTPQVLGNDGHLSQVFMNLVVNAVQAIEGPGTVSIRIYPRDHGVVVEVADDGPGMPEEVLLKVFDPFFTTKPVGKGTGLGLSISYSLVSAHGGTITAQSKVGHGTTFEVWLPSQGAASA